MLFQFLALGRCRAKQGAAGQNQVQALVVILFADQEVLLLRANGGGNALNILAEQVQYLAAWSLMACMERSSGVFLSSASPV